MTAQHVASKVLLITCYKILIKKTITLWLFSTPDPPPLPPRRKKQMCWLDDKPISLPEPADAPAALCFPGAPGACSTPADKRAPAAPRQSRCHLHSPCSQREPNPALSLTPSTAHGIQGHRFYLSSREWTSPSASHVALPLWGKTHGCQLSYR